MEIGKDEVRRIVVEALREISKPDEKGEIPPIHDETDPIHDLGLDSEDGLELACALSAKLQYEIPHDINPLKDDARHQPRRVEQMVDFLWELVAASGATNHV